MPRFNKEFRNLCVLIVLASLFFVAGNAWSQQYALTPLEEKSLQSLVKVNDFPFYTMTYYGAYPSHSAKAPKPGSAPKAGEKWACSLFAALGDPDNRVYGRNFDWIYSPVLLLFTYPPDGYASVSMVDLAYLGFPRDEFLILDQLPLVKRWLLVRGVQLPFDGMNAYGLVVGMATVPDVELPPIAGKKIVDTTEIIREMLDHSRTVDEAVALMEKHHVAMRSGLMLHYLIADATGKAVLVEYNQGRMHVIPNDQPWHLSTNFLVTNVKYPRGQCPRYDKIGKRLLKTAGRLSGPEALNLLDKISNRSSEGVRTQWSVVYGMNNGTIHVVLDRKFNRTYSFQLEMAQP
jgi:hypothetical protein